MDMTNQTSADRAADKLFVIPVGDMVSRMLTPEEVAS